MKNDNYIFTLIKNSEFDIIEEMIEKGKVDVNIVDGVGNDVVMKLLKLKKYDLVMPLMKKRSWNVNRQNYDGDTFGHILAQDNSVSALNSMRTFTSSFSTTGATSTTSRLSFKETS